MSTVTVAGTTSTQAERTGATTLVVLLIIFFLGMGLRLYQLDADSLWLDEIKTANTSRVDLLAVPQSAARTSVHPPLLYIVTNVFFLLFGNTDFAVRLPAALLGSASILLTYKAGKMLWTRKEGLAAAFLLAVNPCHIEYSQEARHYALMVFFALLSLILLIKALETGRKTLWLGFAVSTSLASYTHYFAFLMLPAEVGFAAWLTGENWWSSRRRAALTQNDNSLQADASAAARQTDPTPIANALASSYRSTASARTWAFSLVVSLALIALSYVPWLPVMWPQITLPNMAFQGFDADPAQITRLSPQFIQDLLTQYSGVTGIPLLLFLALFALGLSRCRRHYFVLMLLWTAIPFLFLAFVRAEHWFHPRYALCILPIYLLLAARGLGTVSEALSRLCPRSMDPRRVYMAFLSPMVILVVLLQAPALRDYYLEMKTDWRGAARYLADHLQPGDAIVAEGMEFRTGIDDIRVRICLPYYLGVYGIENQPILLVRQRLWQGLQDLDKWNGRLWGVIYYEDALAQTETAEVVSFHRVSVYRLCEPSGHAIQDTGSLLGALVEMIPDTEARFDVHLALADIYIRTGQLERAASELQMAASAKPENPEAFSSLNAVNLRLEGVLGTVEGMRYPLWRNVGGVLALLGHDVRQATEPAGNTLEVTTWWRALRDMNEDYSVFLHLLDSDGRILAQQDKLLQRGNRPTSAWQVGEIVTQRHRLVLPADAPPGGYTVKAGVYYWETGQRLPVWDEYGSSLAGNVILLHRVDVSDSGE